ncbi:MAG: extracellular solute-binding protein [Propionibacteriaceae bacterium]|jgi:multiple sugar transport system substrate-binding protein|nr:extracellular solute-binding protein [Propionibacteriaceae bacterium]
MNWKKAICVTIAVAASAAMTGCTAKAPGANGDNETLTVLTNVAPTDGTGEVQAKVVAEFEKATGKKVKLIPAGESIGDVYETSVAGGKEADVVMVNLAEKSNDWVKNGIVKPASDYLDAWGLTDKILPSALDAWKDKDGKVQGFPYSGFVWPVWYNMDLLGQAGITQPPKTTDQLIEAAGKLNAAGIPPFIIGGNDWSGQKLFLQIAQSFMKPAEAQKVFEKGGYCGNANAMKGIELFTALRDASVFVKDTQGYTADQMNASFYEGKAAMMSAGSWAFGNAPESLRPNITLGGFPIPSGAAYSKPTAFNGFTGLGFWISPNGAKEGKIDLVKQWITAFYTPEIAAAYAQASNGPVAINSIKGSDATIENTLTDQAVNSVPKAVDFALMPDTAVPGNLADAMIRQTSAAFAPGADAAAICQSLDGLYA